MSAAQASDALARVESVRGRVRGRSIPDWLVVATALVFGLNMASAGARLEGSAAAWPVLLLADLFLVVVYRMNIRASGVKVAFTTRLRNPWRLVELVGLWVLSMAAWEACRSCGGGHAACIVAPGVVGAVASWFVFARRNRSFPPNSRRARAR
ncbi:hypothetical protein ABT404_29385 [Streptomyces hyaluromycini]|uniref:Integral membrane protein n=1 Tax=Streptomyces hyaluromycini TaxID=1377993 RepID=A0ABV1X3E3_9ACTN